MSSSSFSARGIASMWKPCPRKISCALSCTFSRRSTLISPLGKDVGGEEDFVIFDADISGGAQRSASARFAARRGNLILHEDASGQLARHRSLAGRMGADRLLAPHVAGRAHRGP